MLISTLTCTSYGNGIQKRLCDYNNADCSDSVVRFWVSAFHLQAAHIQLLKQKIIFF